MIANELLLLAPMLQQLQRDHPTPLTEDRASDLVVSEQVLREYGASAEDATLGIVRGENDGALGSVYVFLDGQLPEMAAQASRSCDTSHCSASSVNARSADDAMISALPGGTVNEGNSDVPTFE
jgi:hypothetical protein